MIGKEVGGSEMMRVGDIQKWIALALLFAISVPAPARAADQIEEEFCRQALKGPILHPDKSSPARIIDILQDKYGSYFKLNIKSPTPQAQEFFELLGYDGFSENLILPLPSTMNARLEALRPQVPLRFRSSSGARIPLVKYMRAITQNELLVSLQGQFFHDMMDHVVGYLILSESRYWPLLLQKLQALLHEYDHATSDQQKLQARQKILRISNWLEAATQGAMDVYDEGSDELNEYVELLIRQLARLE